MINSSLIIPCWRHSKYVNLYLNSEKKLNKFLFLKTIKKGQYGFLLQ